MCNVRLSKFKCPFPRSLRKSKPWVDPECWYHGFKTMIPSHWTLLFLKLGLTSEMSRMDVLNVNEGSLTCGPAIPGGPGSPLGPASPCHRKKKKTIRMSVWSSHAEPPHVTALTYLFIDFSLKFPHPLPLYPACLRKGCGQVVVLSVTMHSWA